MSEKIFVTIHPVPITYPILIGEGVLNSENFMEYLPDANEYILFCDHLLEATYAQKVCEVLTAIDKHVELIPLVAGESAKTRNNKEKLENLLIRKGCGKDCCLLAIGGGSILDLIGFIAATYCRGVPYISIPTTMLAMVDACVGGKTAVNAGGNKNFIGTIYQPHAVMIEVETLKQLPKEEFTAGLIEAIKHGLIADEMLFEYIEKNLDLILQCDAHLLENLISTSVMIKKTIVEKDEKENGARFLLNFGHTVSHALESLCNYSIRHGEALAFGILLESYFSHHMGYLNYLDFARICDLIYKVFNPFAIIEEINYEQFLQAISQDKKARAKTARFILLKSIGEPMHFKSKLRVQLNELCADEYLTTLPPELLKKGFKWMKNIVASYTAC